MIIGFKFEHRSIRASLTFLIQGKVKPIVIIVDNRIAPQAESLASDCSDTDHTVLPANDAVSAFNSVSIPQVAPPHIYA